MMQNTWVQPVQGKKKSVTQKKTRYELNGPSGTFFRAEIVGFDDFDEQLLFVAGRDEPRAALHLFHEHSQRDRERKKRHHRLFQ